MEEKWLIEEVYNSADCRHAEIKQAGVLGSYKYCNLLYCNCTKEKCPLAVRGNNAK